jgi:hypothetical protein
MATKSMSASEAGALERLRHGERRALARSWFGSTPEYAQLLNAASGQAERGLRFAHEQHRRPAIGERAPPSGFRLWRRRTKLGELSALVFRERGSRDPFLPGLNGGDLAEPP